MLCCVMMDRGLSREVCPSTRWRTVCASRSRKSAPTTRPQVSCWIGLGSYQASVKDLMRLVGSSRLSISMDAASTRFWRGALSMAAAGRLDWDDRPGQRRLHSLLRARTYGSHEVPQHEAA